MPCEKDAGRHVLAHDPIALPFAGFTRLSSFCQQDRAPGPRSWFAGADDRRIFERQSAGGWVLKEACFDEWVRRVTSPKPWNTGQQDPDAAGNRKAEAPP